MAGPFDIAWALLKGGYIEPGQHPAITGAARRAMVDAIGQQQMEQDRRQRWFGESPNMAVKLNQLRQLGKIKQGDFREGLDVPGQGNVGQIGINPVPNPYPEGPELNPMTNEPMPYGWDWQSPPV